ncbi:MAG: TIGR04282 family arsenosugar biosynthesis glycosyltransferase [Planctomycetaceae bacterium]
MPTALGVFAKYWEPGRAKTRLAQTIGAEKAAEIARLCFSCTLLRFSQVADRSAVYFTPPDRQTEVSQACPKNWSLTPQGSGDLGQRMQNFFEQQFAQGAERVVLIGSDSPDLPKEYISEAFEALKTAPVVLGPSEDGGYYLVGAALHAPPIFEKIAWSTPAVWPATTGKLKEAGLAFHSLPSWSDVDDAPSLQALLDRLRLQSANPNENAVDVLLCELLKEVETVLQSPPRL